MYQKKLKRLLSQETDAATTAYTNGHHVSAGDDDDDDDDDEDYSDRGEPHIFLIIVTRNIDQVFFVRLDLRPQTSRPHASRLNVFKF